MSKVFFDKDRDLVKLDRRGSNNALCGYTPDKKLFVELRWHVPKGEFFLDIELVKEGRRVHCETYGSILHMVHNANCVLSHYGSKSEIKLSQDETHILKMNEPSYAAAHNIVLKQWKNCLAN